MSAGILECSLARSGYGRLALARGRAFTICDIDLQSQRSCGGIGAAKNVDLLLPVLSTYLGHVFITGMVSDLYARADGSCGKTAG
jgi:hypothetical protein